MFKKKKHIQLCQLVSIEQTGKISQVEELSRVLPLERISTRPIFTLCVEGSEIDESMMVVNILGAYLKRRHNWIQTILPSKPKITLPQECCSGILVVPKLYHIKRFDGNTYAIILYLYSGVAVEKQSCWPGVKALQELLFGSADVIVHVSSSNEKKTTSHSCAYSDSSAYVKKHYYVDGSLPRTEAKRELCNKLESLDRILTNIDRNMQFDKLNFSIWPTSVKSISDNLAEKLNQTILRHNTVPPPRVLPPVNQKAKSCDQQKERPNEELVTVAFQSVCPNLNLIWDELISLTKDWIDALNEQPHISDIQNLFQNLTVPIIKRLCSEMRQHLLDCPFEPDCTNYVTYTISSNFKNRFSAFQKALELFASKVADSKTRSIGIEQVNEVVNSCPDSEVKPLIGRISEKYTKIRSEQVHNVHNKEPLGDNLTLQNTLEHIQKFYRNEMCETMHCSKYIHPKNLKNIHNILLENLLDVLKSCNILIDDEKLQKILEDDLKVVEVYNETQISIAQKLMTKLTEKMKSEYDEQMNQILEAAANGKLKGKFGVAEKKILCAIFPKYKNQAQEILSAEEHGNSIIWKAHELLLTGALEFSRRIYKNEYKSMFTETNQFCSSNIDYESEANPTYSTGSGSCQRAVLFAFGYEVYMFSDTGRDKLNQQPMPAKIVQSEDRRWWAGQEAQAYLLKPNATVRDWQLVDWFPRYTEIGVPEETINIDNETVSVTSELVLGMLLQIETNKLQHKTNCSPPPQTIIISVPFGLPSYQRQQIVNGAKLAGYENTHLFNENTALAYHCLLSPIHQDRLTECNLLVISEDSDRVDLALYCSSSLKNEVIMTGFAVETNFDVARNDSNEIRKKLKMLLISTRQMASQDSPCQYKDKYSVRILCNSMEKYQKLASALGEMFDSILIQYAGTSISCLQFIFEVYLRNEHPHTSVYDLIPYDVICCKPEQQFSVNRFDHQFVQRHPIMLSVTPVCASVLISLVNACGVFQNIAIELHNYNKNMEGCLEVHILYRPYGILNIAQLVHIVNCGSKTRKIALSKDEYSILAPEFSQDRLDFYKFHVLPRLFAQRTPHIATEDCLDEPSVVLLKKAISMLKVIQSGNSKIPNEFVCLLVTNNIKEQIEAIRGGDPNAVNLESSAEILENLKTMYGL